MQLFKYSEKKRTLSKDSALTEIKNGKICYKSSRGTLKIDIKKINKMVIGINDETPNKLADENPHLLFAIFAGNKVHYFVQDEEENEISIAEFMEELNAELDQMDDYLNKMLSVNPNDIFDEIQMDECAEIEIISRPQSTRNEAKSEQKQETSSSSDNSQIVQQNQQNDDSSSSSSSDGTNLLSMIMNSKQSEKREASNVIFNASDSSDSSSSKSGAEALNKLEQMVDSSISNGSNSSNDAVKKNSVNQNNAMLGIKLNEFMHAGSGSGSSSSSSVSTYTLNLMKKMSQKMHKIEEENKILRKSQFEMRESIKSVEDSVSQKRKSSSKNSDIIIADEQTPKESSSHSPKSSKDQEIDKEISDVTIDEVINIDDNIDQMQKNQTPKESAFYSPKSSEDKDTKSQRASSVLSQSEAKDVVASLNQNAADDEFFDQREAVKSKNGFLFQTARSSGSISTISRKSNNSEAERKLQSLSRRYTQSMQEQNVVATALRNDIYPTTQQNNDEIDNNNLQRINQELERKNADQEERLSRLERQTNIYLSNMDNDVEKYKSMNEEYRSTIHELRLEKENIENEKERQTESLQKELNAVNAAYLESDKAQKRNISILMEKYDKLLKDTSKPKEQMPYEQIIDDLKEKYTKLESEYAGLEKEYDELQKECDDGQGKIDALEKELESVQKQYWRLDEERTANINSLQSKHDALEVSLREKNEIIKEAMKETLSLKESYKEAMDKIHNDSELLTKYNGLNEEYRTSVIKEQNTMNALQSEIDRLKVSLREKNGIIRDAMRETITLKEEHKRAMDEINLMKTERQNHNELLQKYNGLNEEYRTSVVNEKNVRSVLQARNDELSRENVKLQQKLDEIQRYQVSNGFKGKATKRMNEYDEEHIAQLNKHISSKQVIIDSLGKKNIELNEKLRILYENAEVQSNSANIKTSKGIEQKYERMMKDIDQIKEETSNLNKKYNDLAKTYKELSKYLKLGKKEKQKTKRKEQKFDFEQRSTFEPSPSDMGSLDHNERRMKMMKNNQMRFCFDRRNHKNVYSPKSSSVQSMNNVDWIGEVRDEISDSVRIIGQRQQFHKQICANADYVSIGSKRWYYKDINKLSCCYNSDTKWMILTNNCTIRIKSRSAKDRYKLMTFIQSQLWFSLCGC